MKRQTKSQIIFLGLLGMAVASGCGKEQPTQKGTSAQGNPQTQKATPSGPSAGPAQTQGQTQAQSIPQPPPRPAPLTAFEINGLVKKRWMAISTHPKKGEAYSDMKIRPTGEILTYHAVYRNDPPRSRGYMRDLTPHAVCAADVDFCGTYRLEDEFGNKNREESYYEIKGDELTIDGEIVYSAK